MNNDFLLIEDAPALAGLYGRMKHARWLAVDTEFERERTYYPELCLVQITDGDTVAVIDPQTSGDLKPLLDLLFDDSIIKIFHSARQDLEIFFHMQGVVPAPLFDTQIAAPLLGYDDQAGYAALVSQVLGVELDKKHTRTKWKQRPLTAGQLQYAVDDVVYLGQIYQDFLARLTGQNRLDWLTEDFAALQDPVLYAPVPEETWRKIRNRKKLADNQLAALQHLASWRETTARAENQPRNWLLEEQALIKLAVALPADRNELAGIKGLHAGLVSRHGDALLRIIQAAQSSRPPTAAKSLSQRPLTVEQGETLEIMVQYVNWKAAQDNLDPAVLASRKDLKILLREPDNSDLLKGWRRHLLGNDLYGYVAGGKALQFNGQQLTLA